MPTQVLGTTSNGCTDAEAPAASRRRDLVPAQDASGRTESLTLLMCAASVGNHEALATLLERGPGRQTCAVTSAAARPVCMPCVLEHGACMQTQRSHGHALLCIGLTMVFFLNSTTLKSFPGTGLRVHLRGYGGRIQNVRVRCEGSIVGLS